MEIKFIFCSPKADVKSTHGVSRIAVKVQKSRTRSQRDLRLHLRVLGNQYSTENSRKLSVGIEIQLKLIESSYLKAAFNGALVEFPS